MASAEDILNSLGTSTGWEKGVDMQLMVKRKDGKLTFQRSDGSTYLKDPPTNNINTEAFEFPKEPPYDPSMAEIGFGMPGAQKGIESLFGGVKNLFNQGFITERPSDDSNINTGAYENMVPDDRNVLQELPEILSNLEYRNIAANSVLNTPDMLFDMLTTGPQLGSDLFTAYKNNDIVSGLDTGFFEENVIMPEFDELQYDDKFASGEKNLEMLASAGMSYPLYRYLKGKLPKGWLGQKGLAAWAPYTDKVATSKGAGNFFKNLFTGMGGTTIPKLLGTTGLTAGIGTFLNSGPLNAYADDWNAGAQREEYQKIPNRGTNSYTYAPKGADRNNPNEMRNAEVIQNSPQDSIQRYQIPARGPTGPWNNYRD